MHIIIKTLSHNERHVRKVWSPLIKNLITLLQKPSTIYLESERSCIILTCTKHTPTHLPPTHNGNRTFKWHSQAPGRSEGQRGDGCGWHALNTEARLKPCRKTNEFTLAFERGGVLLQAILSAMPWVTPITVKDGGYFVLQGHNYTFMRVNGNGT